MVGVPTRLEQQVDRVGLGGYFLDIPCIQNSFAEDGGLQAFLGAFRTAAHTQNLLQELQDDCARFGRRCVLELDPLADEMERYPPACTPYTVTGQYNSRAS
jgi:hypothetical protein